MIPLYHLQMLGVFDAKAPIIHTEETIGNVQRIKRLRVLHGGTAVAVPAVSGNSFRGQLRDLIGDRFIELIKNGEDPVAISPLMYGVLFSGGVLGDTATKLGDHLQALMKVPMLRVLGSAFGNRMVPSKISVSHLVPLAQETDQYLTDTRDQLPSGGHPLMERLAHYRDCLPSVEELTFEEGPLTRKNDVGNPILTRNVTLAGETVNQQQMIYHVECISGGTLMLQRVASKFPLTDVELGCLLDGLRAFARAPFVGGRGAAGYGRVEFAYYLMVTSTEGQETRLWLDAPKLLGDLPCALKTMLKAYTEIVSKQAQEIRETLKLV